MKDERLREIYTEMGKYEIELQPDPLSLGPKYLQDVVATCRNYLNAVTKVLMEVNMEKQLLTRELNALQAVYEIDADDLLANDERVKRAPNIKDRESVVKTLLREQHRAITSKKAEVNDLAVIEKAVKHRHGELKDTMEAIKTQKSLIQAEISTGAMYGDERAPGRHSEQITPPEMMEEDEIAALLEPEIPETPKTEEVMLKNDLGEKPEPIVEAAPVTLAQADTTPEKPADPPSGEVHNPSVADLLSAEGIGTDEDVRKFLGETPAAPAVAPEDDYSSILSFL